MNGNELKKLVEQMYPKPDADVQVDVFRRAVINWEVRFVVTTHTGDRGHVFFVTGGDSEKTEEEWSVDIGQIIDRIPTIQKYGLPRGRIVAVDREKNECTVELDEGSVNTAEIGTPMGVPS